jgi:protein phosphatase
MRGTSIRQLSVDHTWIQEALDNNIITPDEVEGNPNRHVIRRYLGGPNPPETDFRMRLNQGEPDQQAYNNQGVAIQTGDRLLLCSDGLTDLVSDAEILAAFNGIDANQAVDNLIDLANQRGGHDNITIITYEIPDGIQALNTKRSILSPGCLVAALIVAVIAILVVGYLWLQRNPVDLGFFRPTQEPVQVTLNPMLTSAPQTTATPNNNPKLVPTQTVQLLLPQNPDRDAYPAPNEAVLTPVTPSAEN